MTKVLVYGFSEGRCPYCDKVKKLLTKHGYEYDYFDVANNANRNELMRLRGKEDLKGETVPQVFFDGEFIGGYTETLAKLEP